jgi:poly(A) polymerase
VKEVMSKKGKFSQAVIDSAGGKIVTYGSYRLGVYGPGSDIDALLVAPKTILLEDFFATFPGVLERMSPPGAIEELNAISEAFSPIINLDYLGINIDLNFVSLQLQSVPLNLELKDYNLLRGLSETSLRAINGPRVTDELLALVPQPKTFRTTLRAIKLWAQSADTVFQK